MGRQIVFILILANLVFFLLNYGQPVVVPERKQREIPSDVPLLTLLHERNLEIKQEPAGVEQTAPEPEPIEAETTEQEPALTEIKPIAPEPEALEAEQIETGSTLTDVEQTGSGLEHTEIEETELESGPLGTVVAITDEVKATPEEALGVAEEEDVVKPEDKYIAVIDEEVAAVTEEKVETPVQIYCYTLGPFTDTQMAEARAGDIEASGFPVAQRAIQEREIKHYWIYLPPFASDKAAHEASKKLASNGIKDYFIVTTDENENAISLGLFKRQTGVKRRSKRIREIGFKPKIEVRYRNRTYYWLDYEETDDHQLPTQIWQSIETDKGPVHRITRDCM